MKQEDIQLLIKDLYARVPYRTFVCLNPGAYNKPETCILTGVHGEKVHLNVDSDPFRVDNIKPYLRLMSSMTEAELDECVEYSGIRELECPQIETFEDRLLWSIKMFGTDYKSVDWLNEHQFDYRGLIEKGLALEAPDDMYKQ